MLSKHLRFGAANWGRLKYDVCHYLAAGAVVRRERPWHRDRVNVTTHQQFN